MRTHDGWELWLQQTIHPDRLDTDRPPVVLVPGYGMNTFILGYHPAGTSFERHLAESGFEVWMVELRGQGKSQKWLRSAPAPSLSSLADTDMPAAVERVLERSFTRRTRVHLIGCSLGGSLSYGYLALCGDGRVQGVVTIGSPLQWGRVPAAFKAIARYPGLLARLPIRGTRRAANAFFPLVSRLAPSVLTPYMNTAHVDLSRAKDITQVVDDPHPRLNHDIARWMNARDLVLRGVNVTRALEAMSRPLMLVLSNRDGIVPTDSAMSARTAWGHDDIELVEVGTAEDWYAHADLFVGHEAPRRVFTPIADWMYSRSAED